MVERIKTYIERFDQELGGGIPKGHVVLVSGTPGTMKTSLVFNILYQNAKHNGMRGLYITLEEGIDNIREAMIGLGFDDLDEVEVFMVDVGKIRLDNKDIEVQKDWLKVLAKYIEQRVDVNKFDIIALDSLGALYSLIDLEKPRKDMFHFIGGIKKLGATFFLLTEVSRSSEDLAPHQEDFIADGIIHLKRHVVSEGSSQLRIDIVKMRKNQHKHGWMALIPKRGGFMVTSVIQD